MVEPDTVVRWHRSAWRAYWRWKSRRRTGRPPWDGASVSSGLGSAGASIGHHASVNDVRESAFEAAQRLVPTLASGEFATEVAVAFGARHARLGERRDVERPVQLAVSTAAEAMALDLPARHLKRRRRRVAGVVRARGEATDRSAAPHDLRRQDHADAGDAREGAALYAQRCLEAAAVRDEVAVQHPHLAHQFAGHTQPLAIGGARRTQAA